MKAPRLPTRLTRWAAPVLLAAGLGVSFGLAWLAQSAQEQRAGQNVSIMAEQIGREIRNDIAAYGTTLRGLHGLFISSTEVDREEFRQYIKLLRLQHDAALLQRFSFIERQGEAFVVKYAEPLAGNEAFLGIRIADFPPARDTLARVLAGGNLTLSAPFRMQQPPSGDTGLILYLPLYATDDPARPYAATGRRATALVGLIINLERTLRDIAEPLVQRHVYLRLTELERAWDTVATDGRPFFDSAQGAMLAAPPWLTASRELEVLGNRWRLDITAEPASIPPATRFAPQLTLALGLTLTLLLYLLVRTLGRVGTLATAKAEQATSELGRSEAMFRDLVELSSDWFWEQGANFRYTAMSGGVVNKGNFPVEATLGKARWELPIVGVSEDEWARHRTQLERHEPFRDFVYQIRAADGLLHWYAASGNPVFDAEGRFAGYRGTGHDITRSRQAEQALRRFNAELERRVAERTAALTASNKELEAFSYSVSHDLRAPLRAIDGFAHILAEDYADRLDAAALGHLARIRTASQRMSLTTDIMMELARIDIEREDVDLSTLAATVVAELPEDDGRRVEFLIAPGIRASADRRLMHIVLQNLLHNAWKFTERTAGPRIEFGEAALDGERVFYVRDNGTGFDPAHAGKLFGAFQRLHRPDEFAGTGIGLATVQRIVQRHGGRIWAEGAVGRGAVFYFTLG
ncbi:MAG: CHASE domain-containing protein [Sulfuritalea sp.]|nr:CHASE domain-containing protein [Sulfuritalea sp.]